jgi:hypothetical protein
LAVASAMPEVAPVITATLFSSFFIICSFVTTATNLFNCNDRYKHFYIIFMSGFGWY